jgi:TusA-related sulfurtransferase
MRTKSVILKRTPNNLEKLTHNLEVYSDSPHFLWDIAQWASDDLETELEISSYSTEKDYEIIIKYFLKHNLDFYARVISTSDDYKGEWK